jgi:tRNA 2-thiouridine synthesizing protein A
MNETDQTLDARGLNCPLPILRTGKALNVMSSGKILQVIATDRGAVKDISAFCEQTGHQLVSTQQSGDEHIFMIRKS